MKIYFHNTQFSDIRILEACIQHFKGLNKQTSLGFQLHNYVGNYPGHIGRMLHKMVATLKQSYALFAPSGFQLFICCKCVKKLTRIYNTQWLCCCVVTYIFPHQTLEKNCKSLYPF